MTQVAEFASRLPAWTNREGFPFSWQHFVIGVRFFGKDGISRTIDTAAAVRAGGASAEEYGEWRATLLDKV